MLNWAEVHSLPCWLLLHSKSLHNGFEAVFFAPYAAALRVLGPCSPNGEAPRRVDRQEPCNELLHISSNYSYYSSTSCHFALGKFTKANGSCQILKGTGEEARSAVAACGDQAVQLLHVLAG